MTEIYDFNIHNLFSFRLIRPKRGKWQHQLEMKDLNFRFWYFHTTSSLEKPDLTVEEGPFEPNLADCICLDNRHWVRENYIYTSYRSGRLRYKVEIEGLEQGQTRVHADIRILGRPPVLFPEYLVHVMLVYPLAEYILLQKGCVLLHSAGIANNKKHGLLLAGREGAYKTTLLMTLLRQGHIYLGDDLVIIYRNKIYPVPTYLKEFQFRYKYLPTERHRNIKDKIHMLKYQLDNSFDYNNLDFPIASSANLKILAFVNRLTSQEISVRPAEQNISETAERLLNNLKLEKGFVYIGLQNACIKFTNIMNAYSFVLPHSKVATHNMRMQKTLEQTFRHSGIYEVNVPQKAEKPLFDQVCKELASLI